MGTNAAACQQFQAKVELSQGDVVAARASLERSDAVFAAAGERPQRSTTQAILARTHELLRAHDSARLALGLAEELSAPEDAINFAITHGVRAQLSLAEGDTAAAERWSRSGVERALRTDFPGLQAEAMLELARVLVNRGRQGEAAAEAHRALALFRAKGDRPGTSIAQAVLKELNH